LTRLAVTTNPLGVTVQRFILKLRGLVEGEAEGDLLARKEPISFYGEVDPVTGRIQGSGDTIAGKILLVSSTRGSTVGPYVLYALARRGLAPAGIIVTRAEPLLVAGAVMADVPLAANVPSDVIHAVTGRRCRASLHSDPPRATAVITCMEG